MTTNSDVRSPREVLTELHRRMIDDPLTMLDLYSSDVVHERPFARQGIPRQVIGREENRLLLSMALDAAPVRFTGFRDLVVHEGADPQVLIAEYVATGVVVATGKEFELGNLLIIRVRDGEVVSVRDYTDPLPTAEVFATAEGEAA
jgi:ketosteroid isomerase-like protein